MPPVVIRLTPLWALKANYCIGSGSSACLWKYITVFYHSVHLSNTQIGLIQLLNPSVSFVAQLLWAALCDKLGSYKEVVSISSVLGVAVFNSLLLSTVQAWFPLICFVVLAASGLLATRGSIGDSMALQVVKDYEEAQRQSGGTSAARLPTYGQQRLWSAAGWGGASLLGGVLMDAFGVSFMFVSASVLILCTTVIIATQFPARRSSRSGPAGVDRRRFASFEVIWFLTNMFVYGMCMALVETFLFIFLLRDFQGTSSLLCGSTIAMMCAFEVPIFLYIDAAFTRVRLTSLLSLCHVVFAARCVAYSLLPQAYPATVLLIEPLHGITFAVMWSAAVEYGKRLAPPGAEARMQALINGLYYQLAIGFGSLAWGPVTELPPRGLGFKASFLLAAVVIIIWCCIWNMGWWAHSRLSARTPLLNGVSPSGLGTG